MKILLINQAFFPDVMATAQYLTDLAVALAEAGHEVHVLASRRGYAAPYPVYPSEEMYRGININRVCSFSFGRKHKLSRIWDACLINLAFGQHLLWQSDFDRVVAMTNPPLVAGFALIFSKLKKIKFIYWMMDINPDQAIEAGWIRKNSLAARFFEFILLKILKGSDKIIVLDRFMKERIIQKGISQEKIKAVPLWALSESLTQTEPAVNPFRAKYGLNEKFVVMYSGNLSLCHPLDTVLNAALRFRNDASITFVFIGGGERLLEVHAFKQKHNLSQMICLPYQDRSDLGHSLGAADLHVITMGTPYVGILHPSKIYGILATRRPFVFVGPIQSPIADLIKEKGRGYQVDHGDVDGFMKIVRQVKNENLSGRIDIKESIENGVESVVTEITGVNNRHCEPTIFVAKQSKGLEIASASK